MLQTIVEKYTSVNWDAVLAEEIDILRNYPGIYKAGMNWDTFNPLSGKTCFIGQTGLQGSGYRDIVGLVARSGIEFHTGAGGDISPLEVWSARLWLKGIKEPLKQVFDYIKNGGDKPTVSWVISL